MATGLNDREILLEFLTKDDEHLGLARLGFWQDPEKEADRMLALGGGRLDGESFADWKTRVMDIYYRKRDFSGFFSRHLADRRLISALCRMLRNRLAGLSGRNRPQLDEYLANEGDTIAYALSAEHFDRLLARYFGMPGEFPSPAEVRRNLSRIAEEEFPLDEAFVMDRLRKNEAFYWEIFYRHLRPYVQGFVRQIGGSFQKEDADEIWNEACYTINGALIGGRLDASAGARDLISYAVGMIKNKCREMRRLRFRNRNSPLENVEYRLTDDNEQNPFDTESAIPAFFPSQDTPLSHYVDVQDPGQLRTLMVIALYNPTHPLHASLVRGIEDEVQALTDHYVEKLSYEEIVARRYGPVTGDELVRKAARVRQEVRRVKHKIVQRYEKLINATVK